MNCEFHPEARLEFRESAAFYKACRSGLGVAFNREMESVLQRIQEAPERWPELEDGVRRCLARRFPCAILYTIESGCILVIAVMHCSRRPGYWRNRLPEQGAS